MKSRVEKLPSCGQIVNDCALKSLSQLQGFLLHLSGTHLRTHPYASSYIHSYNLVHSKAENTRFVRVAFDAPNSPKPIRHVGYGAGFHRNCGAVSIIQGSVPMETGRIIEAQCTIWNEACSQSLCESVRIAATFINKWDMQIATLRLSMIGVCRVSLELIIYWCKSSR